jgi:hypothetical protein
MGFPPSPRSSVARAVALMVVVLALVAAPVAARAAGATAVPGRWVRPVPGAVVGPFAAPVSRYGPGHRGADLAAPPGTPVVAANVGTVAFAGTVAGSLHVVVAHAGGLRTSYSFLARVDVRRGDAVAAGAQLGVAGGSGPDHGPGVLHLGLRVGDTYVDPMRLFAPTDLTRLIHLAAVDAPPQTGLRRPALEARALAAGLLLPSGVERMLHPAGPGLLEQAGAVLGAGAKAGVGLGAALVEPVGSAVAWLARRSPAVPIVDDARRAGARLLAWGASRLDCTADPAAGPSGGGSGHALLAVAGIQSRTDARTGATFALDTDALGYRAGEVHWFSYAGTAGVAYAAPDTWGDLLRQSLALRDQLRARQRAEPGREVDLVAHSQGGVIVDAFLQLIYDPADPTLPPIGTVVTLSSPHQGAPLATIARALRASPSGRAALAALRDASGDALPPAGVAALRDLAEHSSLLASLWDHRLPDHVDFTSVSGVDDVVVPADRTGVPGGASVTVDPDGFGDHSAIVRDRAAMAATRLALEGRRPPCVGWAEGLRGAIEPVLITRIEHGAGGLVRSAARAADVLRGTR